ncbi:MAG: class I SAM-dependent methyltransferase [Cyclobacteriaceae bacterium]
MSFKVVSPLTGKLDVILERELDSEQLIQKYSNKFGIDVRYLFEGTKSISIFRCLETGYRFYYPFNLSGDNNFYKHFGKYDWYYLPWKWEHEACVKHIKEKDRVLEVGAAVGDFLKQIKTLKHAECVGLEINTEAVFIANKKGIRVINQSIENHAKENFEKYDVVVSFQVLEHVSNVKEVINSMIGCLKPGGKLVISVPNNDSFIKDNTLPSEILNMPPHHMGLWNESSLKNLTHVFPLKFVDVLIEPLQHAQMSTYQYIRTKQVLFNSTLLMRIFWKLKIYLMFRPLLNLFTSNIKGHTIMCVYHKV